MNPQEYTIEELKERRQKVQESRARESSRGKDKEREIYDIRLRHGFYISSQKAPLSSSPAPSFTFAQNYMEFYSMAKSLVDNTLYAFTIYISEESHAVRIFVEKIHNGIMDRFDRIEARTALRWNFYGSNDVDIVSLSKLSPWIEAGLSATKSIAFTLEDDSQSQKYLPLLRMIAKKEIKGIQTSATFDEKMPTFDEYKPTTEEAAAVTAGIPAPVQYYVIATGPIVFEQHLTLRGLMTAHPPISTLLGNAHLLCELYPKVLLKRVSYCPDEEYYRKTYELDGYDCFCKNYDPTQEIEPFIPENEYSPVEYPIWANEAVQSQTEVQL